MDSMEETYLVLKYVYLEDYDKLDTALLVHLYWIAIHLMQALQITHFPICCNCKLKNFSKHVFSLDVLTMTIL